jgi:nucleotide-binding universal stress UspA family protein
MSLYNRILCPIDGSPTSDRGIQEAISLAKVMDAQILFFHVIDLQPALLGVEGGVAVSGALEALRKRSVEIAEHARRLVADSGVDTNFVSVEAVGTRVSDEILAEAVKFKADLVVIGTHGRRGMRRLLLGSDAESVARQASCAVLLVHVAPKPAPH